MSTEILTGRRDEFRTLRMFGGLAGFPKPSESVTDPFVAGHASSSVSTALGMARARTLQHEDYHVVALMGDGAMTGGLAYEAMNDAGESSEQLIVILNDNGMSITPNVGGIAQHLALDPHAAGLLPHQKGLSRRHGKGARRKVPLPPDAPAQGALEAYALRHDVL